MRVAIMQPYFFPYIGYWQLFFNCDKWVFFDSVQYNKRSWMNRNRVLHSDPDKEFQYINVPIRKHIKGTLIKDVIINHEEKWKEKLLGQLTVYKRLRAPHYQCVLELIENILEGDNKHFTSLSALIADGICEYLGEKVAYEFSSNIDIDTNMISEPDDWALCISETLGATEYINPYGGAEIFNIEKYINRGIDIKFLRPNLSEYKQSQRKFTPGLSLIDVLMFNSVDSTRELLKNDFRLLSKTEALIEKHG